MIIEKRQDEETINNIISNGIMAPCIGYLKGIDQEGEVLVEFNGRLKMAKLVSGINRNDLARPENERREALLIFEQGDPERPIIIALMEDRLHDMVSMEIRKENPELPKDTVVDGKHVTIEGKEKIVLKCGKGSITLRKDGKIIIKGTDLISRSTGLNKIKGAAVRIN